MNRWLKEPLLHFLLLGALIFLAYGRFGGGRPDTDEIVVSRGQQEHLITTFTKTWQRPPTPQEFQGMVRDWIRQEIAYRQGQAMGLDRDDTVIRRRLRQKLELLAEDVVDAETPSDEDLRAYLETHAADYRQPPVFTLRQLYFSPDRRGEAAFGDAERTLVQLNAAKAPASEPALGDSLPLPYRLENEPEAAVARQFGTDFATAIAALEPGAWRGPVRSGFGWHLVFVEDREPGRPLTLEEARADLIRDLARERRQDAIDAMYDRLAERYTITIQPLDEASAP